jgi:hypothetical protein
MVTEWPRLTVLGHGFADAGALPVGLPALIVAAVAVTVAAAALAGPRAAVAPPLAEHATGRTRTVLRVLASVAAVTVAVAAALGPSDVALNPAPRLLFTVGWAGLLVSSAVLGPWWRHASPVAAIADPAGDPARATMVWPAVGGLAVFGLFELVAEPSPLTALAALGVYLAGGAAIAWRGGRQGLAEADPLEVTSAVLGSLAPLSRGPRPRSPRHGAGAHPVVGGLAAFLGVLGGMNLYDALEPTGGLAVRAAIYLAVVAGTAVAFHVAARPAFLTPALIPAVAGHLGAHYLFPLLVDTQIAAVLASDPLRRGWNLLGITGAEINAEPIPAQLGLVGQLLLLVAGHALAMVVAGDLAKDRLPPRAANAALFGIRGVVLLSLVAGVYLRFGGS